MCKKCNHRYSFKIKLQLERDISRNNSEPNYVRKRFDKRAKCREVEEPRILLISRYPIVVSRLRRSREIEFRRRRARLSNSNLRFLAERSYIRQNGQIRSNGGIYSTSRRRRKKGAAGARWRGEVRENGRRGDEARTKGRDHRHQPKARNYGD